MPSDLRLPPFTLTIDGRDYSCEPAVIERFTLTVEDHGLFIADVAFASPGWGQSLPARGLDEYDKATKRRYGTAFGCDFIMECVRVIGSPERAKGTRVVVFRDKPYGMIDGFARLNDDGSIGDPFFPQELANRHYPPRPTPDPISANVEARA